jgi:hypothetical protein
MIPEKSFQTIGSTDRKTVVAFKRMENKNIERDKDAMII